jgi:hypothetical protein
MKDIKLDTEEFDKISQRYFNSAKQGIYTMDEAVSLTIKDHKKLLDEEFLKNNPHLTMDYLVESDKLRTKIFNDGGDNIAKRYMAEDLKLLKKHNITLPTIDIPEGYEIWKYDVETFEPIFRKKQ